MELKIMHPLRDKQYRIQTVLGDLAAQENCDGVPYDQMVEAASYINKIEASNANLVGVIKGMLAISDLWTIPDNISVEHEGEARALCAAQNMMKLAIKKEEGE